MLVTTESAGLAVAVTVTDSSGAVLEAFNAATDRALPRFGAFVWQRARTSLKVSKKTARPGSPPHSHTKALGKSIRFAYEQPNQSVVIGPTPLPGKPGTAPSALEQGGASQIIAHSKPKLAHIRPHPFMGPALIAETPNLPGLWQNFGG